MEFGLSSESEIFSTLRNRQSRVQARPMPKRLDDVSGYTSKPITATPAPTLPSSYFGNFLHESVGTAPAKKPVDDIFQTNAHRYIGRSGTAAPVEAPTQDHELAEPSDESTKKQKFYKLRHLSKMQVALYAMGALLFVGGLGVSVDGWRANTAVNAQVTQLTNAVAAIPVVDGGTGTSPASSSAPAAKAKSGGGSAAYNVAPDQPKYLKIPSIKVNARVLSLGLAKDGSIGTPPPNTNQTGWYNASSKPGQAGAMIIDGHVSGLSAAGVFGSLKKLGAGDSVQVERGDGQVFTYKVIKSVTYPATGVDMDALANPVDYSKPGLNLITCAGKYDSKSEEFNQRVVVFTSLAE